MKHMQEVRNQAGLSQEEIMGRCPAIYAPSPIDGVSDQYLYISTGDILSQLSDRGFVPTMAMQASSRSQDRKPYALHMLRLRQVSDLGSTAPEIVEFLLYNSCDRSRAFMVIAGIFRSVCSNGLVSGNIAGRIKARHVGGTSISIVESTLSLASSAPQILEDVEAMKHTFLSSGEQYKLAQKALGLRFGDKATRYDPNALLVPTRAEDATDDLWAVYNCIQGHVIGGGLRFQGRESRPVRGIAQNFSINAELADAAQTLLRRHRGQIVEGSLV